ncbi:MAG: beta-ketoacyl-[acyl-carrier-protein] synthase family protein, partial [Bacteroidales bacterium]|nr:beta-ketoacyl-[acyl-carrier-protein] synthase family protein [Bacteroidales bacterium]
MAEIVITGLGIISALGSGIEVTVGRLLSEKSAVGKIKHLQTIHCDLPAGEVPYSDTQLREMLNIAPDYNITRTSLMGQVALKEA